MAKNTWVNVNGTFRKVKNVWVKIGDVWKQKVIPKGFIGGNIKEFIQYTLPLYFYGDENILVTYGWVEGYKDDYYIESRKNADHLYLSSSLIKTNGWVTTNRINVSGFNRITVTVMGNNTRGSTHTGHISLLRNRMDDFTKAVADVSMVVEESKVSFSLDVSNLNGEYYVSISKDGYGPYRIYEVVMD